MEAPRTKNRAAVLFCLCCATFCYGSVYAWSAFSGELASYKGWDYGQVTVAYSMELMVVAVMGIVGGALLQKFGARKMIRVAGVMWGLGWILTGLSQNIFMLYLVFGIFTGCASAFGYNNSVVTAVAWYPDKKGFASGMAVGVCGMASLFIAPLANYLLTKFNVVMAFCMIGGLFLVISLATSWYIDSPPPVETQRDPATAAAIEGKNWQEMLKDPRAYLLWAVIAGASVSGLMITGHASRIGQEVAGISSAQAALLVGIMAAANFVGRLLLGSLSDKVGRHQIVIGCMVACALDMLFLSRVTGFFGFTVAIMIAGMCFGGVLATFSAISSDTFGAKYNGINYSIIFTGYGIAAIIGPSIASSIKNSTGSYSMAFVFAAVFSIAAAILCFVVKKMTPKK